MFKSFGVRGLACPRCDSRSNQSAGAGGNYCSACGISLGAPHPLLRNNRWLPQDDEMAVFFGIEQVTGLFRKALLVPPGARAWILQSNQATEVPPGEYELEGFFSRLNHLLRNRPAEILITRSAPFVLEFALADIASAEFLLLDVACSLSIQIESCIHFAQYFMQAPGAITTKQIATLLQPMLRQVLVEFLGAQALPEMAANPALREELNERIHGALKLRLAQFGLGIVQVETLRLQHQKWSENRERQGVLALILDARRVELDHRQQLHELYSEQQWAAIERQAEQQRQQLKRAQLARGQREERANLVLEEREQMQALRAREIELYGRIVEAQNRKQAIERGAQIALQELELGWQNQARERQHEALGWQQVRELAQIKMRTELELAQLDAKETLLLAQQSLAQQVQSWQWQQQLAQIDQIGNEQQRRLELARVRSSQEQQHREQLQLEAAQQQARLQELALTRAARTREAQRLQDWEDENARARQRELLRDDGLQDREHRLQLEAVQQKILDLQRSGLDADALAQQQKLLRTIEAHAAMQASGRAAQRALEQDALEAEQQRSLLRQQEQEAAWQQTLKLEAQAHQQRLARFAALDQVSDLAKVALAELPNAALVADILKAQVQSGMSAEQIKAGNLQGQSGEAVAQALHEERHMQNARNAEERRHLLDMLQATRSGAGASFVASATLATAQVPVAAQALKHCLHGHANLPQAKFCVECGVPLG